ncbi:MAG: succinate dehydrogenase [Candidatus Dormibacteria bacterium]
MATATAPAAPQPRTDSSGMPWWAYSAFFMGIQTLFGIYVLAVLLTDQANFQSGPYLSPFYSPVLPFHPHVGSFLVSPAFFIVWSPLLFRASCYYYRKAYHRAFFTPPACSMRPPSALMRVRYTGEKALPWVLNNLHRFALYTAIVNVAFLYIDAVRAFNFDGHFGIGVGTAVLVVNCVALSAYTFSCHSFRHLVGGSLDCYSCDFAAKARKGIWNRVTHLNERHGLYALVSLFCVWGADVYVRLLTHGVFTDPHFHF